MICTTLKFTEREIVFAADLISSSLFASTLRDQEKAINRYYPPFARKSEGLGISFTVCFLFVCSVNDFSTTRGPIQAKFCMQVYSGSECVFFSFGG